MVQRSGSRYTVLKDTHGFTVVDESGEAIRALNGRGYVKNRDKETAERVAAYLNEGNYILASHARFRAYF